MDQEKRIRISADVSPLREIRKEIEDLSNSIADLSRTPIDADFDQGSFDRKIQEMTDKLRVLQNEKEKLERDFQGTREPLTEKPVIERPQIESPESPREVINEKPLTENEEQETKPKKKPGRKKKIKPEEAEEPGEEAEEPSKPKKTGGSRDSQLSVLRQILQAVNTGNELAVERTTYLEILTKERGGENLIPPPAVPPTIPPAEDNNRERDTDNRRNRDRGRSQYTGIPGALASRMLQSYSPVVNSRNTYEAGAAEIGALGQTAGTIASVSGKMAGAVAAAAPSVIAPGVGDSIRSVFEGSGELVGAAISGITALVSSYAMRAVAKAEEVENNVRAYAQTSGMSNAAAKSQAFREGTYAASDLGINVGEYMNRRARLLRSAGGKILGATEEDVTGRREAESQMAVQRLYGLNDNVIDQLQASLRFARKGEVEFGSSNDSPSGIIRAFENSMRDLKLPFSEIASTIDESLQTFNRTAERILDKAGDFDAGKVATILSNIRTFTGMEGRQLERVQTAITGNGISQDEVTQALLMRVGRELMPEGNLSDILEKIDTMGDDTEFQVAFLKRLDEMTSTDEQLIQLMKSVFTNLNWNDIKELVRSRDKNGGWDYLRERGVPETVKGNEKEAQYERSAGRRTVGAIEVATAEKTNRDAANGEKMLGVLSAIDSKMVRIATDSNMIEKTTKTTNEVLGMIVKLIASPEEERKSFLNDKDTHRLSGSPLVDGQWNFLSEGSLAALLLRKLGID